MMLEEKKLQLNIPDDAIGIKFDDTNHKMSHCMKAVDFIVEFEDKVYFIEFKDLDDPDAKDIAVEIFLKELNSEKKDDIFVRKFRDTFIYRWAEEKVGKPIHYYIMIASSALDSAMILARTDALKRKLPVIGPDNGRWIHQVAQSCIVFNLESWNSTFSDLKIIRTT